MLQTRIIARKRRKLPETGPLDWEYITLVTNYIFITAQIIYQLFVIFDLTAKPERGTLSWLLFSAMATPFLISFAFQSLILLNDLFAIQQRRLRVNRTNWQKLATSRPSAFILFGIAVFNVVLSFCY